MKYTVLSYDKRFFDRALQAYAIYQGDTTIKRMASISGGKDSGGVLLFLCELRDKYGLDFEAVFADTGNEHALTLEYISKLPESLGVKITRLRADFSEQVLKRRAYVAENYNEPARSRVLSGLTPSGNPFLDLCLWKGRFPSTCRRFCTSELKVIPIQEFQGACIDAGYTVESWQGVRAEESRSRRYLPKRNIEDVGLWNVRPVLRWQLAQIVAIHRRHGLALNPLYKMGFRRVGCFPCINERKDDIRRIAEISPETIARLREWEETVSTVSSRKGSTFFYHNGMTEAEKADVSAIRRVSGIDGIVSWARTTRGGKQFDMLRYLPQPECHCAIGLCE